MEGCPLAAGFATYNVGAKRSGLPKRTSIIAREVSGAFPGKRDRIPTCDSRYLPSHGQARPLTCSGLMVGLITS